MANYFDYKGYIGTVEVSIEDNLIHGKVYGINDLVTFESESMSDLKEEFQKAVDDYLNVCELLGKEPDKAYKGQFNVRISPELHKKSALEAAKENITLNKIVEIALEKYLDDRDTGSLVIEKLDEINEKVEECVKACNKETWDGKEKTIKNMPVGKKIVNLQLYKEGEVS